MVIFAGQLFTLVGSAFNVHGTPDTWCPSLEQDSMKYFSFPSSTFFDVISSIQNPF